MCLAVVFPSERSLRNLYLSHVPHASFAVLRIESSEEEKEEHGLEVKHVTLEEDRGKKEEISGKKQKSQEKKKKQETAKMTEKLVKIWQKRKAALCHYDAFVAVSLEN